MKQRRDTHTMQHVAMMPSPCIHQQRLSLLPRLMLLALLLLELLRLFIRLLHRLTYFSLLLPRLDSDCHASWIATFTRRFANRAFGVFPVCRAGTNFVSGGVVLVVIPLESKKCVGWGEGNILVQRQSIDHTPLSLLFFLEELISTFLQLLL